MHNLLISFIAFIFGLIFGSFFNVLIYRLPRDLSIVYPPSNCPNCGHKIKFYENIPIISYILLKGKCSNCKAAISLRYPLVELLTGLVFALNFYVFDIYKAIFYTVFFSILIVQSFIDYEFFVLFDFFSYFGAIFGILYIAFCEFVLNDKNFNIIDSISGSIFGFLIPFIVYIYYIKIRKKEGLGSGDIKLLLFIGVYTGLIGVLYTLFIGSIAGLFYAAFLILKRKLFDKAKVEFNFYIPFGPFLSIGAFLTVFIKHLYINLLT